MEDLAYGFLNEIAVLALGKKGLSAGDVENLASVVREWRAKAAELDSMRLKDLADDTEGRAAEKVLGKLLADLIREDCRRAASRLGACFDWSKAETGLAAEVMFSEVRGATRPAVGEAPSIKATIRIPCRRIRREMPRVACLLHYGHSGPHSSALEGDVSWFEWSEDASL